MCKQFKLLLVPYMTNQMKLYSAVRARMTNKHATGSMQDQLVKCTKNNEERITLYSFSLIK